MVSVPCTQWYFSTVWWSQENKKRLGNFKAGNYQRLFLAAHLFKPQVKRVWVPVKHLSCPMVSQALHVLSASYQLLRLEQNNWYSHWSERVSCGCTEPCWQQLASRLKVRTLRKSWTLQTISHLLLPLFSYSCSDIKLHQSNRITIFVLSWLIRRVSVKACLVLQCWYTIIVSIII